ncbi:MAG: hypothetical protein Q8O67_33225 [Deltaproteobacteria bacterium]|nr:hypothetical protein [Deltaproteobacteria bacterium]
MTTSWLLIALVTLGQHTEDVALSAPSPVREHDVAPNLRPDIEQQRHDKITRAVLSVGLVSVGTVLVVGSGAGIALKVAYDTGGIGSFYRLLLPVSGVAIACIGLGPAIAAAFFVEPWQAAAVGVATVGGIAVGAITPLLVIRDTGAASLASVGGAFVGMMVGSAGLTALFVATE